MPQTFYLSPTLHFFLADTSEIEDLSKDLYIFLPSQSKLIPFRTLTLPYYTWLLQTMSQAKRATSYTLLPLHIYQTLLDSFNQLSNYPIQDPYLIQEIFDWPDIPTSIIQSPIEYKPPKVTTQTYLPNYSTI